MEQGNRIILVLGLIAIATGVFVKFEAESFQKKAVLSDGEVVYVIGSSYRIRYFTSEGSEKMFRGSGKTHGYREGNKVKIWYNSEHPGRVRFTDGRKTARTLFIAGTFFILLGIYPLFQKKKE